MVICAGLTKVFKDFWLRDRVVAVQDVDLQINRGEVFGLLGPNGSGKSTTIKLLLGLLAPTRGRIAVLGHSADHVNVKRRIGYLPEESYLYRFLNARETLDFFGRLHHQPRSQREHRIDRLLEMVGLQHAWRRPVGQYSKGMQRKLGLAQALINDPELLILDEPTAGMDPMGIRQTKNLVHTLRQMGKTVIFCTHQLSDVEDVCDRVAIMYGGRIRALGTLDELLTVRDETAIYTDALDEQTIERIERVLEQSRRHIRRVERPRQKLEALFDQVIHEALEQGAATSGAVSGGQIAGFLRGQGDEEPADEDAARRQVIDSLVGPAAGAGAAAAAGRQDDAGQDDEAPADEEADGQAAADAAIVEQLTTATSRPAPPPAAKREDRGLAEAATSGTGKPPRPAPSQEEDEPEPDRDLIEGLLGGTSTPRPPHQATSAQREGAEKARQVEAVDADDLLADEPDDAGGEAKASQPPPRRQPDADTAREAAQSARQSRTYDVEDLTQGGQEADAGDAGAGDAGDKAAPPSGEQTAAAPPPPPEPRARSARSRARKSKRKARKSAPPKPSAKADDGDNAAPPDPPTASRSDNGASPAADADTDSDSGGGGGGGAASAKPQTDAPTPGNGNDGQDAAAHGRSRADKPPRPGQLSSLYDQVPQYDGGIDPAPFQADFEQGEEDAPQRTTPPRHRSERPDEGFGRILDDAAPRPGEEEDDDEQSAR